MTNDEIFTIAESLGCEIPSGPEGKEFYFSPTELLEFVKSITFAEREACAKVCDTHTVDDVLVGVGIAQSCAAMIRMRSNAVVNGG